MNLNICFQQFSQSVWYSAKSIFDPSGLIQPFTLSAKLLIREIITDGDKVGLDDRINDDCRMKGMIFKELVKFVRSKD